MCDKHIFLDIVYLRHGPDLFILPNSEHFTKYSETSCAICKDWPILITNFLIKYKNYL